ncbi:hypothetical protein, partial [Paenibacillus macerans]|uniref:hypothetical protein n=1 Tax=Paenibacillus macerans TaxID=44252 RepID=UPI0022822D7C
MRELLNNGKKVRYFSSFTENAGNRGKKWRYFSKKRAIRTVLGGWIENKTIIFPYSTKQPSQRGNRYKNGPLS